MKSTILDRYEHTERGEIILDVAARRIEDLYDDFDRAAPTNRRDLDPRLVEYLLDRAREAGHRPFVVRITLEEAPEEGQTERVRERIETYFRYLEDRQAREMRGRMRTSILLLVLGLGFLLVTIEAHEMALYRKSVIFQVFAEGLTVAAWVSIWQALATFLIHWYPHRREIRMLRRLSRVATDLIIPAGDRSDPPRGGDARPRRAPYATGRSSTRR